MFPSQWRSSRNPSRQCSPPVNGKRIDRGFVNTSRCERKNTWSFNGNERRKRTAMAMWKCVATDRSRRVRCKARRTQGIDTADSETPSLMQYVSELASGTRAPPLHPMKARECVVENEASCKMFFLGIKDILWV